MCYIEDGTWDARVDRFIEVMGKDKEAERIAGVEELINMFYSGGPFTEFARKLIRNFGYNAQGDLVLRKSRGSDEKLAEWDDKQKIYTDIKTERIKIILAGLMFKYMKEEMELDWEGKTGIVKGIKDVSIFKIFYTHRVNVSELQQFEKVCQDVANALTDERILSSQAQKAGGSIARYCGEAIRRLKEVVPGCEGSYTDEDYPQNIDGLSKIMKKVYEKIKIFTDSGKTINIYCDNVGIDSIYGTSTNNGSTPAGLMRNDAQPIIKDGDTISINLAACSNEGEMYNTLFHEMAHLIGFNPTGVNESGHFNNLSNYSADEIVDGKEGLKKILFDAYFFETVMTLN